MTHLDLDFVRGQFPAFEEPPLEGFAHFENAGGSYASGQTIEWLDRYYRQTKVQPYYDFPASRLAGQQMDDARSRMAAWLNVVLWLGAVGWIRLAILCSTGRCIWR